MKSASFSTSDNPFGKLSGCLSLLAVYNFACCMSCDGQGCHDRFTCSVRNCPALNKLIDYSVLSSKLIGLLYSQGLRISTSVRIITVTCFSTLENAAPGLDFP